MGTFPLSNSSPTSSKNLYQDYHLVEVEHEIKIIGTLPKLSPISKSSPLEDETLEKHLGKAMEKSLIRVFESPYGWLYSLFNRNTVLYSL